MTKQEKHENETNKKEDIIQIICQNVNISEYYGKVKFGKNYNIDWGVIIVGPVTLGNYVAIGSYVQIWGVEHDISDINGNAIRQSRIIKEVVIGEDVFIGGGAFITAGVHIGSHAVIGANAVVTHDVPEWEVWGGVPARKIGDRRIWKKQEPNP